MKPGDRYFFTGGLFAGQTITYTRPNLNKKRRHPYLGTTIDSLGLTTIEIDWGWEESFIPDPIGQIADFLL